MRILGVDPGSRLTGYGCIEVRGNSLHHITHGTFKLLKSTSTPTPLPERLKTLFDHLQAVVSGFKPDVIAVERVFLGKNASSALKLGHARGVVVLASALFDIKFFEYSPTEIKRAVTGQGRADKEQVARMTRLLVNGFRGKFETEDASDALAVAVCHAQMSQNRFLAELSGSGTERGIRKKSRLADLVRGPR